MKPKFAQLLETCILDGVIFGHKRAYKHNPNPSQTEINEEIFNAIMVEVYEWFDFNDEAKLKDKNT